MLTATQWTTFSLPITVRQPAIAPATVGAPVDLTGCTAFGALFKGYTATTLYPFVLTFAADRTTGQVTGEIAADTMGTIPYGDYLCEVKIVNSLGKTVLLLNESVTVAAGIPHA